MAIPNFIHLRARSAYSLLESSLHINQIKDLCIKNSMPAICISDSNLFGALEFSETMSSNGIQPLIGATLNVSLNYPPTSSSNPIQSSICLIAMTEIGYKNLLKLSSYSFQNLDVGLFPPSLLDHRKPPRAPRKRFLIIGRPHRVVLDCQTFRRPRLSRQVEIPMPMVNRNYQASLSQMVVR